MWVICWVVLLLCAGLLILCCYRWAVLVSLHLLFVCGGSFGSVVVSSLVCGGWCCSFELLCLFFGMMLLVGGYYAC